MATLHLDLTDDLRERLKDRAAESGAGSVEEYVRNLIEADAALLDEEIESLLVARMNDPRPSIEATESLWTELKGKVEAQIDHHRRA